MLRLLSLIIGYGTLAKLGSFLYVAGADIAYFWPANAILAATIVSAGGRRYPLYALAIIPVEMAVDHLNGIPWLVGFQIGCVNSIEGTLIGLMILKALPETSISNLNDLLRYAVSTLLVPALTALMGAAVLVNAEMAPSYFQAWKLWWIGDAIGVLLFVLPFMTIIGWIQGLVPFIQSARRVEFAALVLLTPVVAYIAFSRVGDVPAVHSIVFPMLVWAAMRFDIRGASFVVAEIAVVAALSNMYAAQTGQTNVGPESQALATQIFLIMALLATYILSVVLSEKKRIGEVLVERQMELAASAKLATLGEMAGGVAHEINNPLTIISGRTQQLRGILAREPIDKARVDAVCTSIEETIQRIASIVRGLRAFARDGDRDPVSVTTVGDIINDATSFCKEKCKVNGVELLLPQTNLDLTVECRAVHIVQAVLNLLSNAVHASLLESNPWVKLEVIVLNSEIQLRVSNSGTIISSAIRDRIFQPFFTTKPVGEGTGLGLSISKGLVEQNGGLLF